MKNKNVYLAILFWSLGVSGFLGIVQCIVEIVRFLFLNKSIFWDRVIISLFLSIGLCLVGIKFTKKYE